ncbi:uncharacterized protein PG998_013548 [Apiospora kogelbergensis]|uniref:uncharacterized protein n=1 Tax=Apiospora kogelbergensis TaxID=1337665 RepID=UPI00312DE96C
MSSSQATLRSLYRSLLRELPPSPGPAPIPAAQAPPRAQRQYVTLIERYNPGMGMDEEERTRLTARRVGMDLPVEYSVDDVEGEKK